MADKKTLHLILKRTINIQVDLIAQAIETLEALPAQTLRPEYFNHGKEEPFGRQQQVHNMIQQGELVLVDAETYFGGTEVSGKPRGKFYVAFPGDKVHLYEVSPHKPFQRVWPPLDPVSNPSSNN